MKANYDECGAMGDGTQTIYPQTLLLWVMQDKRLQHYALDINGIGIHFIASATSHIPYYLIYLRTFSSISQGIQVTNRKCYVYFYKYIVQKIYIVWNIIGFTMGYLEHHKP